MPVAVKLLCCLLGATCMKGNIASYDCNSCLDPVGCQLNAPAPTPENNGHQWSSNGQEAVSAGKTQVPATDDSHIPTLPH